MRPKTMYGACPHRAEVLPADNGSVFVCLRENIEEVETSEGGVGYQADEYTLIVPSSITLAERIEVNFAAYLAQAKEQDYETTAAAVRAKRNTLLESTDNYCLTDRSPSDAIIAYRQALRDVPEQPGFPYDVVFPDKPVGDGGGQSD